MGFIQLNIKNINNPSPLSFLSTANSVSMQMINTLRYNALLIIIYSRITTSLKSFFFFFLEPRNVNFRHRAYFFSFFYPPKGKHALKLKRNPRMRKTFQRRIISTIRYKHTVSIDVNTVNLSQGGDLRLECGGIIPADRLESKYSIFGNEEKPIVLLFPSMSNNAHAIDGNDGTKGWWRAVVGYGKEYGIDLNSYRVLCPCPLGSPFGALSPLQWKQVSFPQITPADMALLHCRLLDYLNIEKVHAVVGGSMGGRSRNVLSFYFFVCTYSYTHVFTK
jgi:hypothetical protein